MADVLPSILQTDIFTALGNFITTLVGCEVVRAQDNREAMPKPPFITMTQSTKSRLATNQHTYTSTTQTTLKASTFIIQIDCYGANSADRAETISTMLRDQYGVDELAASGKDIAPLYCGDPHQMPLTNGEEQYEERWTFDAVLQINATVTTSQQTANTLTITTTPVEVQFPA